MTGVQTCALPILCVGPGCRGVCVGPGCRGVCSVCRSWSQAEQARAFVPFLPLTLRDPWQHGRAGQAPEAGRRQVLLCGCELPAHVRAKFIKTSYESWKLLFMDLADGVWAKVYGGVLRYVENRPQCSWIESINIIKMTILPDRKSTRLNSSH